MEMLELSKIASNENKAERYLRKVGILKDFKSCPNCKSEKIGKIRRRKYKCYSCKKEWSERAGSILELTRVSYGKFLMCLKLFELEITVLKAKKQLGLDYKTVHKLFTLIRALVVQRSEGKLSGEIEMDESYFGGKRKGKRGRGAGGKTPVFGILERNGKVSIEIVPDVKAETLLRLAIKKVKRGSLIYTDCYRSYDGLCTYGFKHERIEHSRQFANGKVYINGIEGFWSYAKQRLLRYHGISKELFGLYLKELEFRYNNRQSNLFDKIIENIGKQWGSATISGN